MSAGPAVSFIVAAYQARTTIGEAIASLKAQSCLDWEAIVVDDGSTDGTLEAARQAAAEDQRLHVMTQVHAGVSAARNTALAAARGRWIAFLDADDWLAPGFLQTMLDAAVDDIDILYCGFRRIGAGGTIVGRSHDAEVQERPFHVFARRNPIAIHSVLLRRGLLDTGIAFDCYLGSCEDWDLWQRLARAGARFRRVPQELVMYRLRPDSLTTNRHRMLIDGVSVLRRGFGPDPRVSAPRADLAAGEDPAKLPEVLMHYALWCAAAEVGGGGDGAALFADIMPSGTPPSDLAMAMETILSALTVGRAIRRSNLLPLPPNIAAQLGRLLEFYTRSVEPVVAHERLVQLERMILDQTPAGSTMALSASMTAAIDVRRISGLDVPDGVDRAFLHFFCADGPVLDAEMPILGRLDAWDLIDLCRQKLGDDRLIALSGMDRHLEFRMLKLAYLCREVARCLRRGWLRSIRKKAPQWATTAALMRLYANQPPSPHRQKLAQLPAQTGGPKLDADGFEAASDSPGVLGPAQQVAAELVTVIIPVYNAEATLDETLRSVRGQSHHRLDIIVVDDGSSDRSVEIALGHAAKDPRLRILQQKNGGVARARNHGIREAKGEWIAPIDADDVWTSQKIENQLKVMHRGGPATGLVYSWFAAIDTDSNIIDNTHHPEIEGSVVTDICAGNFIGNGSSPLMRKTLVKECGCYEPALRDAKAQGCEDLLLYFRMAERCDFGLAREQTVGYRETPGAMSGDVFQMLRSYRLVANEMLERHPGHRNQVRDGEAYLACWLFWKAMRAGKTIVALKMAVHVARTDWKIALGNLFPAVLRHKLRRSPIPPSSLGRFEPASVISRTEAA